MNRLLTALAAVCGIIVAAFGVFVLVGVPLFATLWGFGSPWMVFGISGALVVAIIAICIFAMVRRSATTALVGLLILLPTVVYYSQFWIHRLTTEPDLSCHNPLRNGQRSIAAKSSLSFDVLASDWQALETELRHFQRFNDLDGRYNIRLASDFKWFQVTLCREPGTLLSVTGSTTDDRINVAVFQPQGGDNWHQLYDAMKAQISKKWPIQTGGDEQSASIRGTI